MPDTETPNDNRETLSDRDLLERQQKQLDHIDLMLHEVHQFIEEHKPALGRALGFLDPGRSMRDYLKHRPRPGKSDGRWAEAPDPKARSDGKP